MTMAHLDGCVPIRVHADRGRPMVDWCHMGHARFGEPFFNETVERRLRDPFALLFRHQTPLDDLLELRRTSPGVPPAGFIFHMSRCGSTVITQMLAASVENVVLSEPEPVEGLLRARLFTRGIPDETWIAWLQALISAMARPRLGPERRCFVKFDAWQTLDLPLIRSAFPEVPWIFVHRHPVEVLASHRRSPAAQMIPGVFPSTLYGIEPAEVARISTDEYVARALRAICDAALGLLDDGGLPVAYSELPDAAWTSIAAHFGLSISEPDVDAMRQAARLDVKRPAHEFRDDTAAKQASAPAEVHETAERCAMQSWRRLEAARGSGAGAVMVGTG